jgi:hypothetical protein
MLMYSTLADESSIMGWTTEKPGHGKQLEYSIDKALVRVRSEIHEVYQSNHRQTLSQDYQWLLLSIYFYPSTFFNHRTLEWMLRDVVKIAGQGNYGI